MGVVAPGWRVGVGIGVGILPLPLMTPGGGVTLGLMKPAPVGTGPLVGTSGHSGTLQQVGSLGSGTVVQPAGMLEYLAHLPPTHTARW